MSEKTDIASETQHHSIFPDITYLQSVVSHYLTTVAVSTANPYVIAECKAMRTWISNNSVLLMHILR